jgi:nucleotide-binding universal stress UspA family protein
MPRRDPLAAVKTYLVVCDGSDASANAVAVACDLARRTRARVAGLFVIEVPRTLPLDAELHDQLRRGEAVLAAIEQVASDHDVRIEGRILQARHAGEAVLEEAAALGADAIVVGLGYHRPYGRFEIGELAQHLLEHAPEQVWLIRYPPAPPDT